MQPFSLKVTDTLIGLLKASTVSAFLMVNLFLLTATIQSGNQLLAGNPCELLIAFISLQLLGWLIGVPVALVIGAITAIAGYYLIKRITLWACLLGGLVSALLITVCVLPGILEVGDLQPLFPGILTVGCFSGYIFFRHCSSIMLDVANTDG